MAVNKFKPASRLKNNHSKTVKTGKKAALRSSLPKIPQTEKFLRENETKYRSLFESTADPIIIFDQQSFRILDCNQAALNRYGYDRNELLNLTYLDLHFQEEKSDNKKIVFLADNVPRLASHVTKGGEIFPVEICANELNYGEQWAAISIIRDISARKKAKEALQTEKAYFQQLFENSQEAIVMGDILGRIQHINPEFTRVFGYSAEEARGQLIDELIIPPDQRDQASRYSQTASRGEKVVFEAIRCNKNGNLLRVSCFVAPISIDNKRVGLYAVYRDITAQKKAEEALKTEKAYFQQLFEVAQEGVVMTDLNHKVIFSNSAFSRVFGYSPQEAKGHSIDELVAPPGYLQEASNISKQVTDGNKISFEGLRRRKDESLIHVSCVATPIEVDGIQVGNYAVYRDISGHKKTEQDLEKEKAYLEQLFESAQEAIVMSDIQGQIIRINPEFTRIFGYTAEEAQGRMIYELLASPDYYDEAKTYAQTVAQGTKVAFDAVRKHKDGTLLNVSCLISPIIIDEQPVANYAVYRDITAQKEAEKALKTEKAYFQQLFESAQEGVVMTDLDHNVIFSNSAFTRIFGYAPQEAKGRSIDELVAPPGSLQEASNISKQVTDGKKISFEGIRRRKDESLIHVACAATPIEFDGKQVGNYAAYRDITTQKQSEEALKIERSYFKQLFESAQDAIVMSDTEHKILFINNAFTRTFGYTPDEAVGHTIDELVATPEHLPEAVTITKQVDDGNKISFEGIRRRKDNSLIHVSCVVSPIKINDRQVGHYGVYRDITEQRRAEEALQKEQAYLKQLFERSPVAIVMLDKEDRVYHINDEFTRLFGYTEAEALDCPVDSLIIPKGAEAEALSFTRNASDIHEKKIFERLRKRKDGSLIDVAVLLSPVVINNEHMGGYALYQDITERKRAEEILRKAHDELEERVKRRTAELAQMNLELQEEITERKRVEEEMALFRDLVNQSDDTLQIIDAETGRILDANIKAYENLGYTREEFLNLTITDIDVSLPDAAVRKNKIVDQVKKGGFLIFEGLHRRKNGSTFPVEVKVNYVNQGGKEYNIAVARNIEERKRAEEELKAAKEAAEAANRAKSEFLANMSHEIRTPMNAVIGMTGLLMDTSLSAEQLDYIETIRMSADNLLQIINDVLDFSKIEAGKLELEIIEFDLRTAVEDVADMLAGRAFQRGLEFACNIEPEIPSLLLGDPGRLKQILINLTNNAIKFTEKGEVVIRVVLEGETDTQALLRFTVTDTGIGIPESRIHRLFRSFSQIDASTTRKFGGTGLGLAISKQLIEAMHGKIGVQSREGKGSTFWFTLDLEKQIIHDQADPLMPVNLKSKRLLIVDDYPTNCEILSSYLKSWGCYHETAVSAQEALHLLFKALEKQQPFDMMLTDHMMPGMDGETLGRAIKSDPHLKRTILIMLTSRGMRGDALRMKEIGFAGYLTKPIKRSMLFDCILTALSESPAAKFEADSKKELITRHSIEEAKKHKIRILVAEDNAINQKLVLRLLAKFGYRAEAVANGLEAVKALEMIPYDLILMDVQMPEMDGLEATRIIRSPASKVSNRQVPIIALTAHALKGDREICLDAGMNDYLPKPIEPNKLFELLNKYLTIPEEENQPEPTVSV